MGDPSVALGETELNRIGEYVRSHLPDWMEKLGLSPAQDQVTRTQILDRIVRVEERFADVDERVARVEERLADVDERVARVEERLADVDERVLKLDERVVKLDERLLRVEEELKAQRELMVVRFQAMDTRFEDQKDAFNRRFNLLTWMIGIIMAITAGVLGVLIV